MDKSDPQILINNICKNDKQAFNELFLTYYEKLVQFAVHFLNKTEVAEDVVADIFSNMWMKPGKLSGIHNVEAYLYTSVKNACFDQVKREQKSIQKAGMLTEHLSPSNLTMETKELTLLLKNAIAALPEQRRLVFLLVKEHGRKSVEVAEILGISVRTVENQLYKAVKTLANEISQYLGYNPQNPLRNQKGLHLFFFL
jgi:RNA polymerase sigma-70 factor (family 1)